MHGTLLKKDSRLKPFPFRTLSNSCALLEDALNWLSARAGWCCTYSATLASADMWIRVWWIIKWLERACDHACMCVRACLTRIKAAAATDAAVALQQ